MKLFSFKSLLIAAISSFFVTCEMALGEVIEGPFGFDLNNLSKPSDIYEFCQDPSESDYTSYYCTDAPKPHPDMDFYFIMHSEKMGICSILGRTKNNSDDARGYKTRSIADKLANQISLKYSPRKISEDSIKRGSNYTGPENWLKSILKKDRTYGYEWKFYPIRGISYILLLTRAKNETTGYVVVELRTPSYVQCEKSITVDSDGYEAF